MLLVCFAFIERQLPYQPERHDIHSVASRVEKPPGDQRILNPRDSGNAADDIPLNNSSRASIVRRGCMRSESIRWRNTSQIKSRITLAAALLEKDGEDGS